DIRLVVLVVLILECFARHERLKRHIVIGQIRQYESHLALPCKYVGYSHADLRRIRHPANRLLPREVITVQRAGADAPIPNIGIFYGLPPGRAAFRDQELELLASLTEEQAENHRIPAGMISAKFATDSLALDGFVKVS